MHPVSSIFRHRNARASALTIALSTRGRGAHGAPSGVTTSFRPPRFRNVSGMWTVIVSPSAETVARFTPPPSAAYHLAHQPGESVRSQPDLDAMHPHVDPLDQQLHDPRLLGREQLIPQRVGGGCRSASRRFQSAEWGPVSSRR